MKTLNKCIAVILCAVMLFGATPVGVLFALEASAEDAICGESATWTFNTSTGAMEIAGSGEMYDYGYSETNTPPWSGFAQDIKSVNIESVTSVGKYAFSGCASIESVTIGNSVTSIGEGAFENCDNLTTVVFWSSEGQTIGEGIFEGCTNLTIYSNNNDIKTYASANGIPYVDLSELNSYDISFDANGGTGAPDNQTKTENIDLTLSSKEPTKQYSITYSVNHDDIPEKSTTLDCDFISWNTAQDGNGTRYESGGNYAENAEATLWAQWTDPTAENLTAPTREHYDFDGWYTSAQDGDKVTEFSGDQTVYAHWTAKEYTISFDANGGTGAPDNQTKTENIDLTLSSKKPTKQYSITYSVNHDDIPEKTTTLDCDFISWNTAQDGSGTTYEPGDSYAENAAATLWAQWTDPTDENLTAPTREHYDFDGWYTSAQDGDKVTEFSAGQTVYAHWKAKEYTISFDANGGTGAPDNQTKTENIGLTLSSQKPTKQYSITYSVNHDGIPEETITLDCDFISWNTAQDGSGTTYEPGDSYAENAAATLWAQWTDPTDENLTAPTREHYDFDGWYTSAQDGDKVTAFSGDQTVYAHWTAKEYTISFDANGGTGAPDNQTKTENIGLTLSSQKPTKQYSITYSVNYGGIPEETITLDCDFISWNTAQDGSGTTYEPGDSYAENAAATLWAQWTDPTDENLTAPTREHYDFDGWYTSAQDGDKVTAFSGDQTVYAHWKIKEYTISFDSNGGSDVASITADYEAEVTKPDDPTWTGHIFLGWQLNGDDYTFTTMPAEDIELVANWETLRYTISFKSNGGSAVESITADYEAEVTKPDDPTWTGHIFLGWQLNGDDYTFTTMPAENITLEAKWYTLKYTISFNSNYGSFVASITAECGTRVIKPTDPTRTGHKFLGWQLNGADYTFTTMPAENITLEAKWYTLKYTISFNSNGGSYVESITADYEAEVTKPDDPTWIGHKFLGWQLNGADYAFTTMPAENITLTANWETLRYTISFNSNGGSAVESITADYGAAVTKPADPTKEGNKFLFWQHDKTIYSFTTMPAENITLEAKWETLRYAISFNSNGGSFVASITADYGSAVTKPTDPTWIGHKFLCWQLNGADYTFATMPAEDITLVAKWETLKYTISFKSNGGSAVASITADYGTTVTKPTDPTWIGHEFLGWQLNDDDYTFATMPAENIALTAKWKALPYTISFNSNGGSAVASITALYGLAVTKPTNPTWTGRKFLGWQLSGADYTFTTMPAENITLVAKWETLKYTISFNSNGGSAVDPITAVYGAAVTKPTDPTRTGHKFLGWQRNDANYTFVTMPAENITLTAKWETLRYTISFYSNGGSAVASITALYGLAVTKPTDPTWTGRKFLGWQLNGADYTFSTMPAENITLVAKWETLKYTISFNSNGGSAVVPITAEYGTIVKKPTDPTWTGHRFLGWQLNGADYTFVTMPAENIELVANWKTLEYTISFNSNGGNGAPENQTMTYGSSITLSDTVPTKICTVTYDTNCDIDQVSQIIPLNFLGWNTAQDGSGTQYEPGDSYAENAAATLWAQWEVSAVGDMPTLTREYYAFDGWYTDKNSGTMVTNETPVSSNITVYAHWTVVPVIRLKNEPVPGATPQVIYYNKTEPMKNYGTLPVYTVYPLDLDNKRVVYSSSDRSVVTIYPATGVTEYLLINDSPSSSSVVIAETAVYIEYKVTITLALEGYSDEGKYPGATKRISYLVRYPKKIAVLDNSLSFSDTGTARLNSKDTMTRIPVFAAVKFEGKSYEPTNKELKFVSSNERVARVDSSSGKVTALGRGTAVITATSVDNPSAKASYTVEVSYTPVQWIIMILFFGWLWYLR